MRIAYLGWGSLVWDPKTLPIVGTWENGGPVLPIEFSRISSDGRLTLVIDEVHGTNVETLFAVSDVDELSIAIEQLMKREGCPNTKNIGSVDILNLGSMTGISVVYETIIEWARANNFDGVVWTALPSNFYKKTDELFSVDNALNYLKVLQGEELELALEYIDKAHKVVRTPFREQYNLLREVDFVHCPRVKNSR